ncbi:hypothetical protein ACPW96_16400 [Micromonospora sp. DT81.3]|uniref:hypothetical protein n=1 Tax=Actinomycetes TaxID=1760 RepID=UPI003CECEA03
MSNGRVIAFTGKYHGLGNRLRVTLGARSLARWAGRDFAYTWPTGRRFGARFDELWKFGERRISPTWSRMLSLRHPYRKADLDWLDDAGSDRTWQIRTAHALHLPDGATPWGEELQSLEPVDVIADRVRAFRDRHLAGEPYIGVMVRAHPVSNVQTLEHSPLHWYIDRMRELRAERPGVRFFLSADAEPAQAEVIAAIPGTVALDDKGGYNTKAALVSSVVDLYLLAGAGHLIAPHYSSFPHVAQKLAGPGLLLETSMTGPETRLEGRETLPIAADPLRPWSRTPD